MINQGKALPKGITLQDLQNNYNTAKSAYAPALRRIAVLDMADRGSIWETIAKKFPEFGITPDTNYINYIKENILASVYTVGRSASLLARKQEDIELVEKLNTALDAIWGILDVSFYQMQAGERAALTNIGITQVGWNADIIDGSTDAWYEGQVVFKNIDPLNYMRDPYAGKLDDAAYVIYHDMYHKLSLAENPAYKDIYKEYVPSGSGTMETISNKEIGRNPANDKNYYHLQIQWVKVYDEKKSKVVIHEIHTINNEFVLDVKEDIQPSIYPFAELFCNLPGKDPIGVSEPSKILSSSIVLNLLDGIMVTQGYKSQRPPRLISATSGLNIATFAKYGNEPDMAFVVNGDPDSAVRYVQFPPLPVGMDQVSLRLSASIERTSGIDGRYTGKDTGSILTTGGIDSMLAQATMRDTTRIRLYEFYTRRLTQLVISYMIEFGDKRSFSLKKSDSTVYKTVELDFPEIPSDTLFNYSINISAETPKNKQRIADMATMILEKTMQYGANPPILTVEEWLMYQDFPQKDLILDRLKNDRMMNATEKVTQILSMFSGLVEQGMTPEDAIDQIAQQLEAEQTQGAGGAPSAEPAPQAGPMMPQGLEQSAGPQGGMPPQGMPPQMM